MYTDGLVGWPPVPSANSASGSYDGGYAEGGAVVGEPGARLSLPEASMLKPRIGPPSDGPNATPPRGAAWIAVGAVAGSASTFEPGTCVSLPSEAILKLV